MIEEIMERQPLPFFVYKAAVLMYYLLKARRCCYEACFIGFGG